MTLFSDALLADIHSRGEAVNGSFLVSILVRDEPQIRVFRESMEGWFRQVPDQARDLFSSRLTSVRNEDFFQGFAELAMHQLMRRDGYEFKTYPTAANRPFYHVTAPGRDTDMFLSVSSFIPEGHPHYARRAYKTFIDELNKIKHHYRFAVFLRRWLPPEFDPSVVRRALENWFNRLDSDPHGGQYAEYRDGGVHVEFSILGRVSKTTDTLVGFNLVPLETQSTLARFREVIDTELARHRKISGTRYPLVLVLFNNDEWRLSENYIYDFFYGKPRYSFNWQTDLNRKERIRDFSTIFAASVFNSTPGHELGAVILAEKIWGEAGVDLKVRCLHNPWCKKPLPDDFFIDRSSLRLIAGTNPEELVVRWSHLEDMTVHLT